MSFNQYDVISLLSDKFLKLVNKVIYVGSNISSTESDVNIRIGKAWAELSDEINRAVF